MVKENDGNKHDEQAMFIDSESVFPRDTRLRKSFEIYIRKGQNMTCSGNLLQMTNYISSP